MNNKDILQFAYEDIQRQMNKSKKSVLFLELSEEYERTDYKMERLFESKGYYNGLRVARTIIREHIERYCENSKTTCTNCTVEDCILRVKK